MENRRVEIFIIFTLGLVAGFLLLGLLVLLVFFKLTRKAPFPKETRRSKMTRGNIEITFYLKQSSIFNALFSLPNKGFATLNQSTLVITCFDQNSKQIIHEFNMRDYVVDLFPRVPDFDLFLPENPIRCTSKLDDSCFYLYVQTASFKEDWFLDLKQSSLSSTVNSQNKAAMAKLLTSCNNGHPDSRTTQWLNAILGRLFISIHANPGIKEMLIRRISSQLTATSTSVLGDIIIKDLDFGDSIPSIGNPTLTEVTAEGGVSCEMGILFLITDIEYTGGMGIKAESMAIFSVDNSIPFVKLSPLTVPLKLGITIKKFTARLCLKIKPHFCCIFKLI